MSFEQIPEETIQAVLKSHDIVEVVGRFVHLTKRGRNYTGLCPFHSEKTPSFSVSPEKQIFHCFGCGTGGDAIKFMMEIDGLSFPEAVTALAEEAGIPVTWQETAPADSEHARLRNRLIEAHELAAKWFHFILKNTEQGAEALAYLERRGFTAKLIDVFQIGYAPNRRDALAQFLAQRGFEERELIQGGLLRATDQGAADLFRDRVMFPIHDPKGKTIAFSGRVLQNVQPKYLNTPETILFNKSRLLYNFHLAKPSIRKSRQIVLFEGFADVMKAWEAEVFNGVATMGTALTEEHAAMLKRNADEVVVCYDGDDAGRNAAFKSLSLLDKVGCKATVALLPAKMDPDEYIAKHGTTAFRREIVDAAVSAIKFRLLYARRNFKLDQDEGRLQYIKHAVRLIASLHSPTEREHYLKELSLEFDYAFDTLKQECFEQRQELEKKKRIGDNIENPWNTVLNDRTAPSRVQPLLPAHVNAERHLLRLMLQSKEVADYAQARLGGAFHVEAHAAVAAYLYAYYTEHAELDLNAFIRSLNNPALESLVRSLAFSQGSPGTQQEIDDYIESIKLHTLDREMIEKQQQLDQAQKSGNIQLAAQIGAEMISLRQQIKALKQSKT